MGVQPIVLARLLNHIGARRAGVTMGVYVSYSFDKEAREASEMLGERLRALVKEPPS